MHVCFTCKYEKDLMKSSRVAIDPLILEIFMFESVDTQTDARTDGRTPARPVYYKLTSEPLAQVS